MNRLQMLAKSVRGVKNVLEDAFFRNMMIPGDDARVVLDRAYSKMELVYICISTTARAISQVPLIATLPPKGGSETRRPVPADHPWQKRINFPNNTMNSNSFTEALVGYILLDGEVFIVPYPPGTSDTDPPGALFVIRKRFMTPEKNQAGQLVSWAYNPYFDASDTQLKNQTFHFLSDEVAHVKLWNPYDQMRGLSPLEAGGISLLSDYRALQYNDQFFQEGAVPGGMLSTDQKLSNRTFHRIRDQFDEHHKGLGSAHKVAVLEQGLSYTQAGLSHKDMEFLELRKYSRDTIMQIFGMKSSIISIGGESNANIGEMQRKEWWQSTNLPLIRMIQSALNRAFFKDASGVLLEYDISNVEALHENFAERVKTGELLFKMGFTAEEINARLNFGFNQKPWRTRWYIPTNMAPVNDDGTAYIQNPTGAGAPGQMTPNNTPAPQAAPDAPGEGAPTPPKPPKKPKKGIEFSEDQVRVHKEVFASLLRGTEQLEAAYEKKLSRLFFEMRGEALTSLEKSPEGLVTFGFPEAQKNIRKYTKDLYLQALAYGYNTILDSKTFDGQNPKVAEYLASKDITIIGIIDTVHKQISVQISEGISRQEALADLTDRIKGVFNNASRRAKIIARTEVWGTMNFARSVAISEHYEKKIWVSVMDGSTRESHALMNGSIILSTDVWNLPTNCVLRFPGDLRGQPKEVIGCRCFEMPVKH